MRIWEYENMREMRLVVVLLFLVPAAVFAQQPKRPYLGPIDVAANFEQASADGTRTRTGAPGPRYWQNTASYKINARLIPETKRLDGSVQITYINTAPHTIANLHVDLTQNFHQGESVRNEPAE